MTWNQIAERIDQMPAKQRKQQAVLIDDHSGPEQRVRRIEVAEAERDVYDGITVGNVLVLRGGESFLRTA